MSARRNHVADHIERLGYRVLEPATRLADAVQFLSARGYVVEPRGDRWRPHCPDAEWVLTGHGMRDLISGAGLIETVSNMRWLEEGTVIGHGRD